MADEHPNKLEFPTILDVSASDKGSGHDVIVEAIYSNAEVNLFPAVVEDDTSLEVSVMTDLPGGETFRRPNEGVLPTKTTLTAKKFDMSLVDRRVEVDRDGIYARTKDKPRFLVNQSVPQASKALSDISKQIIYGKLGDMNKGFPGLIAQASVDEGHAIDAGGTTDLTSVWLLDIRPSSLELVFGSNQSLTMNDDWKEETVYLHNDKKPSEGPRRMLAMTNRLFGWVGLRLWNINRVVHIRRIGTTVKANNVAGNTLTSDLMVDAMNLCTDELGFTPTHILGNGRSFEQLRKSLATPEVPNPARLTAWDGVPIVRSINILKNEETIK